MFCLKKYGLFFVILFFFSIFFISLVEAATTTVCSATVCNVTFDTSNSSWPVPTGVTSITGLVVGGGGGGCQGTSSCGGGTGGALRYSSSITVVPGTNLKIVVGNGGAASATPGKSGGFSSISNTSTYTLAVNLTAAGGGGGSTAAPDPNNGTSTTISGVITGGNGGAGGTAGGNDGCGGGGGAGGWYGDGGAGGAYTPTAGSNSTGGGGGGGGGVSTAVAKACGGGGGVGIVAAGNNGTGGVIGNLTAWYPGTNGSLGNNGVGAVGGLYGGGGGGTDNNTGARAGAAGAVVITYQIPDSIYPLFSNYNITYITPANNTAYSSSTVYTFNATVSNTNATVGLQFNGVNYTTSNLTASVFNASISNLAAGTHTYYWWAYGNGTSKNFNVTSTLSHTVAQATPVITKLLNGGTSNITITYPQQINATGSATGGTIKIYRDTTDATSENGLNVSLSAGGYIYKFNVTENTNYSSIAGEYMQVNISKATLTGSLTNTTSLTVTYPQQINVSYTETNTGDGDLTYKIYRDGIDVTSEKALNVTLSAGTYNYILNSTGGANYSTNASISNFTIIVNKATPVLTFRANGGTSNLSLIYPQQVNISATASGGTLGLDKDNVNYLTSNSLNVSLSAGSYIFRANITGNQNYSDVAYSYYNITINKTVPQGALTNTTSLTVTYPTAINVSYTETNTGDGDLTYKLYRDNVDVTATEKGLNVTLSAGTYNYILNSTGGANYSTNASISNFTITVAQATPVITKLLNGGTSNITITYPQQVNATGSSTGGTIKIYRDTTDATSENGLNVSLSAGGYIYKFNVTGNTNYSSIAGEYMQVNISKAASSVNLTLNNSERNITIIAGTVIDLNCSTLTGDIGDTLTLYQEGSVINSGNSPIGNTTTFNIVQTENITCIHSDSQNYTSSFETWFVRVNAANTCTCAGLNTNWEINMADNCVINDNCNLGAGNITFIGVGWTTFNATINCKNLEYPVTDQKLNIDSNALVRVG